MADQPTPWRCRCGFTATSAILFRRHLARGQASDPVAHALAGPQPQRTPRAAVPPPPPPLRERLLQQLALTPPASHALDSVKRETMAAVATSSRGRAARGETPPITADDVEALLAWDDPTASAKALFACLYGLVCIRAALYGSHFVQPVTLAAAAGGIALAAAAAAPYAAAARDAAVDALRARGVRIGDGRGRRRSQHATVTPFDLTDDAVAARVAAALAAVHAAAAPAAAAVAVVIARRLTGARGGVAGQVWLGVSLYCAAAAAEARLLSNASLTGLAIAAAFAATPLANALAGGADAVALEAVAAARALVAADARSAVLAAGAAGVTLACAPVAWLPRLALAAAVGGGVLVRQRA